MSETFALEAVLMLKQHKEDAEERALSDLGTRRQQVQATLDRVLQEKRLWTEDRNRELGSTGTGASQQSIYARLHVLRDAENQLKEQQRNLEERIRDQQAAYLAARRARETLTELKKSHVHLSKLAGERREQRRLEDLFLGRWGR